MNDAKVHPSRRIGSIDSIVFAPPNMHGGVKSLYSLCDWLSEVGHSSIVPFGAPGLADWFDHNCLLYDDSYAPGLAVYPEVFQPPVIANEYRVCFALGQRGSVAPYTDLIVCRSAAVLSWVKGQELAATTQLILPSIDRAIFEYDGRHKTETICYMTRPHKHPEIADLLHSEYGDRVVEIVNRTEAQVAETLKDAKVFVWFGDEFEGSPRPPKEALVAGCVVVGMERDLNDKYRTNFGVRCTSVEEVVRMAGEALNMPMPSEIERGVVRDSNEERSDWLRLIDSLALIDAFNQKRDK